LQDMEIKASRLLVLNQQLMDRMAAKQSLATAKEIDTPSDHKNDIQLVSYDSRVATKKNHQSLETLESTTKSLPRESVSMFKRKIEPLLIHSCYTAKCHHSNSDEMPLLGKSAIGKLTRRISQRNLYSILKFADFDQPMDSRLLSAAALPHAGQENAILKIGSQEFQNLRVWLISVSSTPYRFHEIPAAFFSSDLTVDSTGTTPPQADQIPEAKALKDDHDIVSKATATSTKNSLTDSSPDSSTTHGPSDPFDPTLFNTKYRAQSRKQESSKNEKN
ncbi:MAG: hypothetical protein AAGA30_17290, partial [Planctomycetota bacterium]